MITACEETTERGVTFPEGFSAAAARCGLKSQGDDLALITCDRSAAVAGMFTTNVVQAPCVHWSRKVVRNGRARAVVCNAGNANACNGHQGDRDNERMAELTAASLGVGPGEVAVASTGVIGHPMPMSRLAAGIPRAAAKLARRADTDPAVGRAIMTTDTRLKQIAVICESSFWSGPIRIGAVCKGAGMIAPRLGPPHATLLCFLTTDADIPQAALQEALGLAAGKTLNRVTVDGDTSPNDMVLLFASGAGGTVGPGKEPFEDFRAALERVCRYLAREVARDGEGATKLVELLVRGARNEEDADRIARTIAESPLVKTALFGCDPNWGRILAAAGRSGIRFDPEVADLLLGEIPVYQRGAAVHSARDSARAYLEHPEVRLILDLNSGASESTFWTCDFSYDYVKINAEYHT